MRKFILCGCLASLISLSSSAQSGTNSAYSQYGLGILADPSQGFNRGMNGAGLGLRKGNVVNTLNPASYSAIDSLTMIMDVGVSGQLTNFEEGDTKVNAKNGSFEYAVGSFRLMKNVGIGFGILPYSNVGYKYASTNTVNDLNGSKLKVKETHSGDGGLRQVFVGAGWCALPNLSLGANFSYLWGTVNRTVVTSSSSSVKTLTKNYSATVSSYNLDFGLQWMLPLKNGDQLTLGATVGVGHKLNGDPTCQIIEADTTTFVVENGLSVPMTYSVGLAWIHKENLLIDADFSLQKWGSLDFPHYNPATERYQSMPGLLKDRIQVRTGLDWVPAPMSQKLYNRIHYRAGFGYTTPYYNINGGKGPNELSVSAGFGIPIQNSHNSRSVLNVSAQWVRSSAKNLIEENTFRVNVGLTFNERWFAKWKIE